MTELAQTRGPRPWTPRLAACAAAAVGLALALEFTPYQVDDAYIYYRYVEQLLGGYGLAFNAGGPAIEGFTSPLWLAALTGLAAVFGTTALPALAVALGATAYLVVMALAWRASNPVQEPLPSDPGAGLLAVLTLALCPALVYYAATGMDSILFGVVLVAFAGAAAGTLPLSFGVVAGALSLWTRPEAGWLPIGLACQLVAARPWQRAHLARAAVLSGAVVASGVSLVAVRWLVFGEVLPNTYFAKEPSVWQGLAYVARSFASPWAAALAVLGIAGAWVGRPHHRGWALAAASWAVAAALEGGDWMRLGRLLLPSFLLLGLASGGLAFAPLWRRLPTSPRLRAATAAAGCAAWTALCVAVATGEHRVAHTTLATLGAEEREIARWLEEGRARSVALVDIGLVGFETGVEIVDLGGLTDAVISRSPGGHVDKQFDLDYVFESRRPDVIVIRLRRAPSAGADGQPQTQPLDAESSVEARLLAEPRMARDYRFAVALLPGYSRSLYYGRLLFVRKDFTTPAGPDHPLAAGERGPLVLHTKPPHLPGTHRGPGEPDTAAVQEPGPTIARLPTR